MGASPRREGTRGPRARSRDPHPTREKQHGDDQPDAGRGARHADGGAAAAAGVLRQPAAAQLHRVPLPGRRGAVLRGVLLVPHGPRSDHELPVHQLRRQHPMGRTAQLPAHRGRSELLGSLAHHGAVHAPRVGLRLRGAVPHRRGDQRTAARPFLLPAAGLPAGDDAAGRRRVPVAVVLQSRRQRAVRRGAARAGAADRAVAPVLARPGGAVPGAVLHLDQHGRHGAGLPGRAAEHPRRAVRGGRDSTAPGCCAGCGTSPCRRPG